MGTSPLLPERLTAQVAGSSVFASEAKQSREAGRFRLWRSPGLLRCARNDEGGFQGMSRPSAFVPDFETMR